MSNQALRPRLALGVLAAIAGGYAGYVLFFWIARQGFLALLIPPGLLGLAAGYGVRHRSQPFAIACGVAGLALAVFSEWKRAPLIADKSLIFFASHLYLLPPITLVMLVISPVISYRLALGMDRAPDSEGTSSPT